jgi:adenine phosphoribosyltransferase
LSYDIDAAIRRIPHHPKPGILFYDLMPLFEDPQGLAACVDGIAGWARDRDVDVVLGAEARGFILGGAIARSLDAGFACARKPGKLPFDVITREYDLEYGTDTLEIHRDAIRPGQRVLVHDDLLATGGTAAACMRLIEAGGGEVVGAAILIEIQPLGGRERLTPHRVEAALVY